MYSINCISAIRIVNSFLPFMDKTRNLGGSKYKLKMERLV